MGNPAADRPSRALLLPALSSGIVRHRPAHDPAGMKVEHRSQVIPTTRGPDVGDIATPHLIGLLDIKFTGQQIGNIRSFRPGNTDSDERPVCLDTQTGPGNPNKKRRGKQPGSAGEQVQPPVFICPKTTMPSWVSCTCAARTLPPQKLATSIKAPASPYLIHDFIVLLPSHRPLATPVASGLFISGQKIGGICEEKMRLCEARVKSGGSLGEVSSEPRQDGGWQCGEWREVRAQSTQSAP